jgi:hypothetical protein
MKGLKNKNLKRLGQFLNSGGFKMTDLQITTRINKEIHKVKFPIDVAEDLRTEDDFSVRQSAEKKVYDALLNIEGVKAVPNPIVLSAIKDLEFALRNHEMENNSVDILISMLEFTIYGCEAGLLPSRHFQNIRAAIGQIRKDNLLDGLNRLDGVLYRTKMAIDSLKRKEVREETAKEESK